MSNKNNAGLFLMDTSYTIHILNYNYNPHLLLKALLPQIVHRSETIKLVVRDDGSGEDFLNNLAGLKAEFNSPRITWKFQNKNRGRAAMRQTILESENDGWLVSIDSDMVPDPDFIDQMISSLQDIRTVYTGSHYYQDNPPATPYLLHWHYGRKREVPARKKNRYNHFSTGIVAVHSTLTEDLHFEASIKTYGHEDTLFGLLLQKKNIPVKHAPMKALHTGLSTTDEFITKQLESVRNLQVVFSVHPEYKSRLIKWSQRINKLPGATKWVSREWVRQWCINRLHKNPDRLIYLDLLKLSEYISHDL